MSPESLLFSPSFELALLHGIPEILIDNPQFRDLRSNQIFMQIDTCHVIASIRILRVADLVPYKLTDIELVIQDAGATLPIPVDSGR
ncbi:MAG: hypothetical protein BGP08_01360 [Rhizobiales bacterium 64-17]|nr:MAG: hypothetical protein BGP08_01360 [Rhizobiales bacterium 64-17]